MKRASIIAGAVALMTACASIEAPGIDMYEITIDQVEDAYRVTVQNKSDRDICIQNRQARVWTGKVPRIQKGNFANVYDPSDAGFFSLRSRFAANSKSIETFEFKHFDEPVRPGDKKYFVYDFRPRYCS